jgi:ankyrin repeat protein
MQKSNNVKIEFEKHLETFLKGNSKSGFFDKKAFSPNSIEYRHDVRQWIEQENRDYFEFEASTLDIDRLVQVLLSSTAQAGITKSRFKALCNHIEHQPPAVICVYRCSELSSSAVQLLSRINEYLKQGPNKWKLLMFGEQKSIYPLYLRQLSPEVTIGKSNFSVVEDKPLATSGNRFRLAGMTMAVLLAIGVFLWINEAPKPLDHNDHQTRELEDTALAPAQPEAGMNNIDNAISDEGLEWQSRVDEFERAMVGFSAKKEDKKPTLTEAGKSKAASGAMPEALYQALMNNDLDEAKQLIIQDKLIGSTTSNAETPLIIAGLKNNLSLADWLIEQGSDVNSVDSDGRSALFYAAVNGNPEFAKKLLANNADIDQVSRLKKSPLMAAVHNNHVELCNLLLSSGSNVNKQDHSGWSALFYAVWNENLDIVKTLKSNGADIELTDRDGYSVIDVARNRNASEILQELNSG